MASASQIRRSALVLSRTYASAAGGKVKAPIQMFGMEGRYATALFTAAVKQNKLDQVTSEIEGIRKVYEEDKGFREFILNPTLKRLEKKGAMDAIAKKLGFSPTTTNFFDVVAENGRLAKFEGIMKSFGTLISAHRGEVLCEVVTAKPLDSSSMKELQGALAGFTKQGQKLQVSTKVDPDILGGMIISIGDKYVDMSTATKIRQFEDVLKQAI